MADNIGMKRKLTGAFYQSLDGIIEAAQPEPAGASGPPAWITAFSDESSQRQMGKLHELEYDLLLGKRTYDSFAAYWPRHRNNPLGEKFHRVNKYVLTHSEEPLAWEGSSRLSGDTATAVAELKKSAGRDLLLQGGSTIYLPLLAAGLMDRLILLTFPVLLGKGKRIFDGSGKPGALQLVDHFVSNKGVVFATYEPNGEAPIS